MSSEAEDDIAFWARTQYILQASVDSLRPEDRQGRIDYCRRTGDHGIRAFDDGAEVRFEWGGKPLAVVKRTAFTADAYLQPLTIDLQPLPADDPPDAA